MPPDARKYVKNWDQVLDAALAAGAVEVNKHGIVKLRHSRERDRREMRRRP